MWTALQTCDKNEGRQREAKPGYTNELDRFTARTPWFVPHLFGEICDQILSVSREVSGHLKIIPAEDPDNDYIHKS